MSDPKGRLNLGSGGFKVPCLALFCQSILCEDTLDVDVDVDEEIYPKTMQSMHSFG